MEKDLFDALNSGGLTAVVGYLMVRDIIMPKIKNSAEANSSVYSLSEQRNEFRMERISKSIDRIADSIERISMKILEIDHKVDCAADQVSKISTISKKCE